MKDSCNIEITCMVIPLELTGLEKPLWLPHPLSSSPSFPPPTVLLLTPVWQTLLVGFYHFKIDAELLISYPYLSSSLSPPTVLLLTPVGQNLLVGFYHFKIDAELLISYPYLSSSLSPPTVLLLTPVGQNLLVGFYHFKIDAELLISYPYLSSSLSPPTVLLLTPVGQNLLVGFYHFKIDAELLISYPYLSSSLSPPTVLLLTPVGQNLLVGFYHFKIDAELPITESDSFPVSRIVSLILLGIFLQRFTIIVFGGPHWGVVWKQTSAEELHEDRAALSIQLTRLKTRGPPRAGVHATFQGEGDVEVPKEARRLGAL